MVTKNGLVEETRRLLEDGDEEVSDWRGGSKEEDDPYEVEGAGHCAQVGVAQGDADGDEALHSHAS